MRVRGVPTLAWVAFLVISALLGAGPGGVAGAGAEHAPAAESGGPETVPKAAPVTIGGRDPVSYFAGGPVPFEGSREFEAEHGGRVYRFASQANRARFLAEPDRFAPAYGAFCAYGVRMGQLLEVDPEAFRVVGGRLFLFHDLGTRLVWMMDEPRNIEMADGIWPTLRKTVVSAE